MGPGRPGACGAGSAAPLDASGQVPRMPGPATHLRTRWRVVTANPAHPGSPVGLGHAFRRPGRPPPSPRIAQMAPSRGPQGPSPPPASGHPWEPGPLAPGARRHGDAVARPLRRHEPVPVPCQGPLARGAAASLGDSLSPPGSRMRLPAASSPLRSPAPSWVTLPALLCLRVRSLGALPPVPGPAARLLMPFLGPASRALLQCPAASRRHSSVCCRGRLSLSLDLACAHRHLAAPIRWRWWVGNCPEDIRCQSLPSPRPPKDYSSCQWRPTAAGRSRRRRPGRPPAGRGPGAGASSAARQGGRASPARGRPGTPAGPAGRACRGRGPGTPPRPASSTGTRTRHPSGARAWGRPISPWRPARGPRGTAGRRAPSAAGASPGTSNARPTGASRGAGRASARARRRRCWAGRGARRSAGGAPTPPPGPPPGGMGGGRRSRRRAWGWACGQASSAMR
jgi:hypothetical protein